MTTRVSLSPKPSRSTTSVCRRFSGCRGSPSFSPASSETKENWSSACSAPLDACFLRCLSYWTFDFVTDRGPKLASAERLGLCQSGPKLAAQSLTCRSYSRMIIVKLKRHLACVRLVYSSSQIVIKIVCSPLFPSILFNLMKRTIKHPEHTHWETFLNGAMLHFSKILLSKF